MTNEINNSNTGAIVASMIIVIILLAGGYFAWRSSGILEDDEVRVTSDNYTQPAEAIAPPIAPPQESTEIGDIAADAAAIDFTPLDTGLDNLDILIQ